MPGIAAAVDLDQASVRGVVIGAGLGLLNLAVGYLVMRWALRQGMRRALGAVVGGLITRLVILAGLIILFQRTGAVDPTSFAFTFFVFFLVYLGLEVLLVQRSPDTGRR
ncbi:MAG: hypothetical protein AB1679_16120 [Actinomycetota bacterium]